MRPIKIAVDIRDLRIAKTGVKTYTEELIKAFSEDKSGKFIFCYFDTTIPVYTGMNKFLKIIEHGRFFVWKQIMLPFKAWLKSCDIIFCADFFVPYFPLGAKNIPVLHDAFFFEYPQHYNKIWLWLFKTLGIGAAKQSSLIITPTQYTKDRIAQLSGISEDKIMVVYEGPKTLPSTLTTENRYPFKYILHVGVLEKRKNIVNLLKAYLIVRETNPQIKLILIGQSSPKKDIDDSQSIIDFISQNDLTDDVILPGYVSDKELADIYNYALLYIFPSINEGFGIPVLEAFSKDLPILIANNSCLPEVAGDAAILFDPYNPKDIAQKLNIVIADGDLRKSMIKKGRVRLMQFSWQKTAAELMAIFEKTTMKKN